MSSENTNCHNCCFPSFWKKTKANCCQYLGIWFKDIIVYYCCRTGRPNVTSINIYINIQREEWNQQTQTSNIFQQSSTSLHFLPCLHLRGVSFSRNGMSQKPHIPNPGQTNKQTLITDPKPGLLTALLPGAGCVCVIVLQLGIFLSQDTSIAVLAANLQLLKLVILLNPG